MAVTFIALKTKSDPVSSKIAPISIYPAAVGTLRAGNEVIGMAVFRIEKTKNYTTMSNIHLQDKSLSLKGKGLLSMMLSLPEDWGYSIEGLVRLCKESYDGVSAVLKELEVRGYLTRERIRTQGGKLGGALYTIYEKPLAEKQNLSGKAPDREKPVREKPIQEKPVQAKPVQEIPGLQITNIQNTNIQNTNPTKDLKGPVRYRYGAYKNVLLSDEELKVLRQDFPCDWADRIESLSEYMASSGKSYRNHLATMQSWARKEKTKKRTYSHEMYVCKEGESL